MTAVAAAKSRKQQFGAERPRIAPPLPARTEVGQMLDVAKHIEIELYPWQITDCRYLSARSPSGWLWPEVATLVARQNGKTTVLELLVLTRMVKRGHRVMHSAQNLSLPIESHDWLADTIARYYPELLGKNGVRKAQGQQAITLKNGAHYRVRAATRSGARGGSNDLVVIDEVLDFDDFDFVAAIKPTLIASKEPQIAYFSNAGTPESAVLTSLRNRGDNDRSLAYLEWSAPPDSDPGDIKCWLLANPSVGHNPALLANLEREYQANLLGNTMDIWDREHLCRWTARSGQPPLLNPEEWERLDFTATDAPRMPILGVKVDPSGSRASAVLAWQRESGIGLEVVADVTGDPIDMSLLGPDMRQLAAKMRAKLVVFDPTTDADLARYFVKSKPMGTRDYAAATEKFVHLALNRQIAVRDSEGILARDLQHTVRTSSSNGTYVAIKDAPDTTNTAIEAAIRAAWHASEPKPFAIARIH